VTLALIAIGGTIFVTVALFAGIVWLVDRKAKAELESEGAHEAIRKLRAAAEADARARERIARDGLLADDGHRRD
jgi:hypothetical protein